MTSRCPRCDRFVYAAEQILGPGRKFYHKPCLACTLCKRRLDSYTLLEHDEQPYCKPCHLKSFGTRDLRHANLPYAPVPEDPPLSIRPPPIDTDLPRLRPTRVLSPTSTAFPRPLSRSGYPQPQSPRAIVSIHEEEAADSSLESSSATTVSTDPTSADEADELEVSPSLSPIPTHTGRPGLGNLPRTVPLSFDHSSHVSFSPRHKYTQSLGSIPDGRPIPAAAALSLLQQEGISPLRQTPTGTRYGAALGMQMTGSARKWGGTTPQCPKCSKSVYFAEQVKAVGKTYHKYCLRCSECNTSLDSTKLRDHDELPFCVRCYNKLHGPQGQGYALLGKAGG